MPDAHSCANQLFVARICKGALEPLAVRAERHLVPSAASQPWSSLSDECIEAIRAYRLA